MLSRSGTLSALLILVPWIAPLVSCGSGCPDGQNRVCDEEGNLCSCNSQCESHEECESGEYCNDYIRTCLNVVLESTLACGRDGEQCCQLENEFGSRYACFEGLPCDDDLRCRRVCEEEYAEGYADFQRIWRSKCGCAPDAPCLVMCTAADACSQAGGGGGAGGGIDPGVCSPADCVASMPDFAPQLHNCFVESGRGSECLASPACTAYVDCLGI
jgi:hypothetical protein